MGLLAVEDAVSGLSSVLAEDGDRADGADCANAEQHLSRRATSGYNTTVEESISWNTIVSDSGEG